MELASKSGQSPIVKKCILFKILKVRKKRFTKTREKLKIVFRREAGDRRAEQRSLLGCQGLGLFEKFLNVLAQISKVIMLQTIFFFLQTKEI